MAKTFNLLIFISFFPLFFSKCLSYLKFHSLYDGIGLFSSLSYKQGDIIGYEPFISLNTNFTRETMIDFYATVLEEKQEEDILIFGTSLIYNHHPNPNVHFFPSQVPIEGKNDLLRFVLIAVKDIPINTEMFISYGTDLWFEHRKIKMIQPDLTNPAGLNMKQLPGCIRSTIIYSQGNIYTTERIKKGEIIEINRGLVIPGHVSIGNDLEEYVWFRENYNQLRGSLLLLGNGALMNSPPSGNIDDSNVIYSWYDINSNLTSETTIVTSIQTLFHDEIKEIKCSLSMLVMFTALRDIEANEILYLPLTRDSTPFTITINEAELKRARTRKYRADVKRKLVIDKFLPGDCF